MNIVVNGKPMSVPQDCSIAGLLESLELSQRPLAVELNSELVPLDQHPLRTLSSDDQLEIVTLVGGG